MIKIKMLKTIGNFKFAFQKDKIYAALDGDEDTSVVELQGKFLVRRPDSPVNEDWWCSFPKSELSKSIEVVE